MEDSIPRSLPNLAEGGTSVHREVLKERIFEIGRLTQIINDVLSKETLTELYELILNQTISHFGFDYGAISRVDYKNRRVKTEIAKSNKPDLVNPNRWKDQSDYSLDDGDILVDVVKKKRSEIISGPDIEIKWDPRLNESIYMNNNHKDLVRLYVPFTLRKTETSSRQNDKGVKSIEEKVLGVIEAGYHIDTCNLISEEQRALFELFINYCAGAFQRVILVEERMAVDRIVERVNAEESLLSSEEEIYDTLKDVVEEYLKVDTVTIWEKNTAKSSTSKPFRLRRVAASKFMEEQYDKEDIWELPQDCLTVDAMNKIGEVTEVKLDENTIRRLAYPHIALRNNLGTIITIPISIGQETYAVADVFFDYDRRLTVQEKEFLEQFARRAGVAMVAVQSNKLVNSFSTISDTLIDEDIEFILQNITDSALDVLHADPVILFRYDQRKFLPNLISSGSFNFPEVNETFDEVTENHWPSIILNLKGSALYLETEKQYLDFQAEIKRVWDGLRFTSDFWHREQIKSLAALRLEHDNEPVGIMFVNYRTPQKFNEPTQKLIRAFAAQAAAAIARTKQFWETQRRDSFSLSVSEIVGSLAHNSVNLLNIASVRFANFDEAVRTGEGKTIERERVQSFLDNLKEPWDQLLADFTGLEEYKKFDEFLEENCQIDDLVEGSLFLLKNRLEKQKVNVKKNLTKPPEVMCAKHQVTHMLLNLFLNALDAMGRKGTLSVGTDVKDRYVRIRVTDNGVGIAPELRSEIFKPYYTTKKHGTGLGLPISRYIARKHGGRIEFTSKSGKESTFSIYLPIAKAKE